MRRKLILLGLGAALLCLCGCGGLDKRNARMEDLALLRVLAVDGDGTEVSVSATTGETREQSPVFLEGTDTSVARACLLARGEGDAYPSYSHVEQILVGEELARQGLTELLDYLERDVELRLSSRLWLIRGEARAVLTEERAEQMVERLNALEEMAGMAGNGLERTAGDVITARDRSGYAFLPALALTEEGELVCAGYGVLKDDTLLCWLEGDCALGVDLMMGALEDGAVDLTLEAGDRAGVRIGEAKCRVRGEFEGEKLTGLKITCRLRGTATRLPDGLEWTEETQRVLEKRTAAWAEDCIAQSAAMMQSVGADPLELCRRAGRAEPWRWDGLSGQWEKVFPMLDIHVEVTAVIQR